MQKARKRNKRPRYWEGRKKMSLFVDDAIFYGENPMESTPKLRLTGEFS